MSNQVTTVYNNIQQNKLVVVQLSDNCYQCIMNSRTYVGILEWIKTASFNEGLSNLPLEIIPIAGIQSTHHNCLHEYVDVGFSFHKWVCKHCDKEKPLYS